MTSRLWVRRVLVGASIAAAAAVVGLTRWNLVAQCGPNPIVCENQLPGNPQSEWDVSGAGDTTIQGFATDISVNKGDTVHFKVTTTAAGYSVTIYRLGYYQGNGARKIATIASVAGQNQPTCLSDAPTGLLDCGNWTESASWLVPTNAVSGVYIARLKRSDNSGASHIVFVVRDDARTADILLQTNDTTWQAYNQYGGHSLYLGTPTRGYKVSYNRPFATRSQSSGYGTSNFVFYAEYPMIRWMESNGYDVKYWTGVDTNRFGSALTGPNKPKIFLMAGHDEYWSGPQRAAVEAARDAAVNMAFMTGNEVFWKTRYEPSIDGAATPYRTLVTYKETHENAVKDPADPPTWTGTWRDPRFSPPGDGGRPENSLSGQLFTVNRGSAPISVPGTFANLRFWRNTSVAQLAPNQTRTLAIDTLGYEWDEDVDNGSRPAGAIKLSSTTVNVPEHVTDFGSTYLPATATHSLVLYRASSGALVFGAGTVQWVWGLDTRHDVDSDFGSTTPDPDMQQATVNLFADMGVQPGSLQGTLTPATASTDQTRPTSTVVSPAPGDIAAGTVVTISGTASDAGGVVGGVEVSVDGGATWKRAAGTASWSYTWVPGVLGPTTILSRAADDSGNIEQPSTSVPVTITQANCPCTLFTPSVNLPWMTDSQDGNPVEVGMKFRADTGGFVNGVRFYKATANTGTHTGHLWTSAGQQLAAVTFTGESASGWQQANFSSAVPVQAGVTYVVSYFAPNGHYSDDQYYFGKTGVDQWPLHGLKRNVDGPNGVFNYGSSGFPSETWFSDNYWLDLVFTPELMPPAVTMTAPASGASISGNAVTVSATASDDNGVAGVQFKIDGVNLGGEDTTSPYSISWNSTLTANGSHTLTAVARDIVGNLATSAPVPVSVFNVDTVPPTASVTSPVNTATLSANSVTLTANASDNQAVVGVTFLVDGAALGAEIGTAPYTTTWDTTALANNSTHAISARARDTANNLTTSASNSVTIVKPVAGAPAIDTVGSIDKNTTSSTATLNGFSTTASNELVLAFISADYLTGANTTVTGITGGGLTWTLVRRTNVQAGTSEVWRAFAVSPISNASIAATFSQSVVSSMTVVSFSNVDVSGTNGSGAIGATGSGNSAAGAPTASLTTTRANSWVFGVGNDYDTPTPRTPGSNQVLVHQALPSVGDTYWVQRTLVPTPTSGTLVTITDTAPNSDRYNLTIVEILPLTAPDTIPPTVSIATPASGATVSGTAVSVSASASDNVSVAGVQFKLDGANLAAEDTAGPYAVTWNSTTAANGSHTLTAVARDGAGNTTTSAAVTVTVNNDTTPPTVSISSPADGSTVADAVTVTAAASDNVAVAGVQFKVDGANFGAEDTASPYSISWDTTAVANGSHTLSAVARDAAGNTTTSAAVLVTVNNVDATPPTVSLTAPANGATAVGNVTVSASASDDAGVVGVQFKLDGANLGAEDTASPYSLSWDTTTIANGSHSITAVARDAAGNSATSTAVTVTVNNDVTAPTISMTAPADGATVSGTAVSIAATATDNVAVVGVQFKLDGAKLGAEDTTSPYGITWDSTTVANGSHSFTAVARDTAGNTATATAITVTVNNDTTAPTVAITAPAAGATVSDTIAVSAGASDNVAVAGVQFKLDGANLGAEVTAAPYQVSWNTTTFTNGSHTLTAVARDAAGNTATSGSVVVTVNNVDGTAPTVSMTAPVDGSTIVGTVAVSATAADNVAVVGVQFKLDGADLGAEDTASPYSVSWNTLAVANGAHALTAVARDAAGNTTTAATITVTVNNDVTPPTVSMTAPADSSTVSGAAVAVTADAADNVAVVGVQFLLDGVALGAEDTASPYSFTWNTTGTANGSHTLSARARDAAGNTTTSAVVTVTVSNTVSAPVMDKTVFKDQPLARSTVTTAAFSTTSANELLLAFIATDAVPTQANVTVTGVSGAGLTWVLVARANAQMGTSEIWRAFAPTTLANVAVTATLSKAVSSQITVVTFSNVDTTGTNGSGAIGAVANQSKPAGAPIATLITTRDNSWVFGVGNDFDNPLARTLGANQTMVHQYLPPVGDTYWVQRTTNATPTAGTSVDIYDTAPSGDRFNLAICEIRPPQ